MSTNWFSLAEKPYTEEDAAWDDFVAHHPHGSILQTTNWARLKNRFGWSSERVWLKLDGSLVAGAQILYRSAVMGLFKIGYIPHGPLVNWEDDKQVEVLISQIDESAFKNGAGLVKMEPLLWQDEVGAESWQRICQTHDLLITEDTIQPPRTIIVDIGSSEDEILAAMKSKTRYNVRLSARKCVTVREGSGEDLHTFANLMQTTGQRDGFGIHAPEYYATVFSLFAPNKATLLIAEYENKPLAAAMITALGDTAVYLYGASSNEERNRMPAYAVQWAAIRWARAHGCTRYDLWGVPDTDLETLEAHFTERSDGLWPVYRAKRGYGGQLQRTVGAVDRVYNDRFYRWYNWYRSRQR
jgi:peptidoglycan pentaglycine glycine transferase (the first glycine)